MIVYLMHSYKNYVYFESKETLYKKIGWKIDRSWIKVILLYTPVKKQEYSPSLHLIEINYLLSNSKI